MVTLGYTLNFYRFCNHSNCHARSHGQVAHCLSLVLIHVSHISKVLAIQFLFVIFLNMV